jgi:hypothetical protein
MKTDVIRVSGKGNRFEAALKQADKVAAYKELSRKGALHLRLLTEEMMGMMRSITGEPEGDFWIEEQDGEYELHLRVKTLLSAERKEQLLAASTSGKNESAKGLMGRLREFFDYGADETLLAGPLVLPDMYEHSSIPTLDWEWTMSRYEGSLYARMEKGDAAAKDAWDELEKSVVKHVADDIKVSIRGREAEMIILKKLA